MDYVELESSSEDDDYVNSVARLKVLQNQIETNHNELSQNNNQSKTRVIGRGRRRGKRRSTDDSYITCDLTEDLGYFSVKDNLEIISVPDENAICRRTRKNSKRKVAETIILNYSSEEGEDLKKDEVDLGKDEDFDVNVKILWRSKIIHRVNMNYHENFSKVFQHFADLENVSIEQILIMKKNKHINLADTPSSLGLSIIDILDGGIVDANIMSQNNYQNQQNNIEEDICQVKVQTANKESLVIPLKKNQQFQILIASCAREWGVKKSNIKLYFDGDPINDSDTPESLDLEQEACIDLRIIK